ncbi:hypothetical protein POM88_041238 [Heracleum sosnowskyi]|uniref:Ubiquitin-like domain-containing protein n=1 Tax=Heracleum sosnowskyi TaxID=360622 RepID=A0AAD8HDU3_9APIA|nr:hypothetical protein POM88_041238 [Heracleum sosnowskyi]
MNSTTENQLHQLIISSPELPIRNRTLTLDPNLTFRTLKSLLLPNQTLESSFFFTFNGKPLSDSTTIKSSQIAQFSTLKLNFRLNGGGGDGGSTCAESRDCYLNMYASKKPDKLIFLTILMTPSSLFSRVLHLLSMDINFKVLVNVGFFFVLLTWVLVHFWRGQNLSDGRRVGFQGDSKLSLGHCQVLLLVM